MIELLGDIGAGKTTFTQGLALGLGYHDEVPSPTFTIARSYPVRNGLTLHHLDFYRLSGHDIATDQLSEFADDPEVIVVIEWPGNGGANLPEKRLQVRLSYSDSDSEREIVLQALDPALKYLIEGISHDSKS